MVDPGEAWPVVAYLIKHRLVLSGILITHHHSDHVGGVTALTAGTRVPVFGPMNCSFENITHRVTAGESLSITPHSAVYHVMNVPGHTLDHVAYYTEGVLFCGDTLFAGGCGRLFEGTAAQMYASLQAIAGLPDDTKLYCAHEYTLNNLRFAEHVEPDNPHIVSRMAAVKALRDKGRPSVPSFLFEEKQTNPFLRCDRSTIIRHVEQRTSCSLKDPIQVFAALREWKNHF